MTMLLCPIRQSVEVDHPNFQLRCADLDHESAYKAILVGDKQKKRPRMLEFSQDDVENRPILLSLTFYSVTDVPFTSSA